MSMHLLDGGQHVLHQNSFAPNVTLPDANKHPMFYIAIYAAIGIGGGIVGITTVCVQYLAALRASRSLFRRLLETVVHSTMRWFDTTPTVSVVSFYLFRFLSHVIVCRAGC